MAQSTVTPAAGEKRTRKANPIFVDAASLAELRTRDKNVIVNFGVHPAFAASIYERVAATPGTTVDADGKTELKRTSLTAALRTLLAGAVEYTGETSIVGRRGGNVVGTVSAFQSIVRTLFESSRTYITQFGLPEEQVKAMAFQNAKDAVSGNQQLSNVEVTDEILEALWSGGDIEAADDEDDEDDDE